MLADPFAAEAALPTAPAAAAPPVELPPLRAAWPGPPRPPARIAGAAAADAQRPAEPVHAARGTSVAADTAVRRKRVAHQLNNLKFIAASYVLTAAFLWLFHLAGTVGALPAVLYFGLGLTSCAVFGVLIGSGWSSGFDDPNLTLAQSAVGSVIQLGGMWLYPQVGFMFLLVLFVVYVSATLRMPVRHALFAWAAVSLAAALVLGLGTQRTRIPDASFAEQALSVSFFALTLGRCMFLGAYNSQVRSLLRRRTHELAELTSRVEELAHRDELTGLLNRASVLAALRDELQRSERSGVPVSVAVLDLDRFKQINDRFGHPVGDRTLTAFASTAQRLLRATDRFARWGGEEFLLVFSGTSAEAAQIPVQRVRAALAAVDWSGLAPGLRVTFSAGITAYRPGEGVEALVHRADEALYRAKREGRNCSRLG